MFYKLIKNKMWREGFFIYQTFLRKEGEFNSISK